MQNYTCTSYNEFSIINPFVSESMCQLVPETLHYIYGDWQIQPMSGRYTK